MISIMSQLLEALLLGLPSRQISLDAGQYLFHAADPVCAVYIVQSGWVHLVRWQPNGNALVQQRAGPQSILAEASLYTSNYHCDAVAEMPAHLLTFKKADLLAYLQNNPETATALSGHLAREIQVARMRAEIIAMRTVAERLDAWLTWHGGQLSAKGEWKRIATEIAVTPEALYREIAKRRK